MRKEIIILFLLTGIVLADGIVCNGDDNPNLNELLHLNCTTALRSTCFVVVKDQNSEFLANYYPPTTFGEDRIGFNSLDNGRFIASMFIDEGHYSINRNYTAEVVCAGEDNSTNTTTFDFSPAIYKSPNFVAYWMIWAQDNWGLILAVFVFLFLALAFLKLIVFK